MLMIYLERRPVLPLAYFVDRLWYCRAPDLPHARERVLPTGRMQILFNLASDALTDCCAQTGEEIGRLSPSLLVGPRSQYELIDSRDLLELVGILFHPGGAAPLLREDAGALFERFIPLKDLYSGTDLRDRLRELPDPVEKLAAVEQWLLSLTRHGSATRKPVVVEGLKLLRQHSVQQVACSLGVSERRLHQVFKTEVGLSPKQWASTARFQRAIRLLHAGQIPRWDKLALDCGYYDQSHFCREFKAFSGIDPSTYVVSVGEWANHVRQG
jgi:AraC-like DNA-binding protein